MTVAQLRIAAPATGLGGSAVAMPKAARWDVIVNSTLAHMTAAQTVASVTVVLLAGF